MKNVLFFISILFLVNCSSKKSELGTKDNPIKIYFTPSVDAETITKTSQQMMKFLEEKTGYFFKSAVPANYITVVEAFGSDRADVAIMNSFGFILANTKYGAKAYLKVLRFGKPTYKGQIIAHVDSKIEKIEDLNGKRFAFTDASSTSGYLYPTKILSDHGVKLANSMFAMKHDNVVTMIYQKQVDAGATFYSEPKANGEINDARARVKTQFPDVEQKIKIIALTNDIPNDPVVFNKNMKPDMYNKIIVALKEYAATEYGKKTLNDLYSVDGFVDCNDDDFKELKLILQQSNTDVEKLVK